MKIIITTPLYPPEIADPAPYAHKLAQKIACKNQVTVLTYANNPEKSRKIQLLTVKKNQSTILRILKYTKILFQESKKADIIYAQNGIAANLPSIIIGKIRNIPVFFRFNEDEAWERAMQLQLTKLNLENFLSSPAPNIKIKIIKKLQNYILQSAEHIVTTSNYLKKILIEHYNIEKNKITTNHTPQIKEIILPLKSNRSHEKIVVTINKFDKKGAISILESTQKLKNIFKNIHITLLGKHKHEKELQEMSRKLNIDKNIDFAGDVSPAEKLYVIKNSQIHVIISSLNNDPEIIMDAILNKIPIIIADSFNIHNLIKNKKSGLIFEKNNSNDLQLAIKNILKNSKIQKEFTDYAYEKIKKEFSWDRHINILYDLFNKSQN